MSKVDWCLKKAEAELKNGKLHRGLVKISPNLDEAKKHLEKAEHNFLAITSFKDIGFSDWSMSAAFYTIYHCFLAILVKEGYESRNQECTLALINELNEQKKIHLSNDVINQLELIDQGQLESNIIGKREFFQYGTLTGTNSPLENIKAICQKAIDETKEIIYQKENKPKKEKIRVSKNHPFALEK